MNPVDASRLTSRRRLTYRLAPFIGVLLALVCPATSIADDSQFVEEVSVNYVLVPVVVRSGDNFMMDLERHDFEILIDGEATKIESFDNDAGAPVSIVFLQDLSGSMRLADGIPRSRELVRCLVGQRSSRDSFALATFASGQLEVRSLFESEPNKIVEDTLSWRAFGTTGLNDAIAWLPDIVLESPNPKRAAVLITDGVDNASSLDMQVAADHISQAELPVFIVGLRSGDPKVLNEEGEPAYPGASKLDSLAARTGGKYYFFDERIPPRSLCDEIRQDLRFHYLLGFATQGSGSREDRQIEVRLTKKFGDRMQILHRVSYRGLAPLSGL